MTHTNRRRIALVALPLSLASLVAAAAQVQAPADVESTLRAAGFTEFRDVERDNGVWEAEVRRADGTWGEVAIAVDNGEVFDARGNRTVLDARGVTEALERAGYTEITDLDRDGALWEAEARDGAGQRVELTLSGYDGRVLESDVEYDD